MIGLWLLAGALAAPVNQAPAIEVVEPDEDVPVWKLGLVPAQPGRVQYRRPARSTHLGAA